MTGLALRSHPAFMDMSSQLSAQKAQKMELRREVEQPTSTTHVFAALATLAGGGAAGAVRALAGKKKGGIPTDFGASLVVAGLSIGAGSTTGVHAAAGMAAPFFSNMVEDTILSYWDSDDDDEEEEIAAK